jgi:hypothetical protein
MFLCTCHLVCHQKFSHMHVLRYHAQIEDCPYKGKQPTSFTLALQPNHTTRDIETTLGKSTMFCELNALGFI